MSTTDPQPELHVYSLAERPDLADAMWELYYLWPLFVLGDTTGDLYYDCCLESFADLVLVAEDAVVPGVVAARAFAIPYAERTTAYPDDGWDGVVRWGIQDLIAGTAPTHMAGLEITIREQYQGAGLAGRMIEKFKEAAASYGVSEVVIPVRPTHKAAEPHADIDEYTQRTRDDGLPADPWLRTHVRSGARIVGVAPRAMVVVGSLDQWRSWTNDPFDADGPTLVEGALVPVDVDLIRDHGVYVEPNVWVSYTLD